jgi:hypothetical protein
MKPREVFRTLRQKLEAVLLPLGFSRSKDPAGQILAWTRPMGNKKYEAVCCQVDKWPWDPWIGSKFVVEFQHARGKEVGAINGAKRARLADLLTTGERREVEDRQNRIIAKFRVPSAAEYSKFMGFPVVDADLFLDEYREECRPVKYGKRRNEDIWLRILDEEDVQAWADFLASWLPGALERFAALKGEHFQW